jgi:hypothetical protein
MARDPLDTLLRVRRLAVQNRIRDLAAAVRDEEQACQAQNACGDRIARETAAARSLGERDAALAGFTHWRVRAMQELRAAEARATEAGGRTRGARALLAEARAAMRAVEFALERRKRETDLLAQRAAQHVLDDATRRPV